MEDAEEGGQLFEGVIFTVIPCNDISLEHANELRNAIQNDGGRFIPLSENNQQIQKFDELTHIVSTHTDFPQYNFALEHGIIVVKPTWATQSIRNSKLAHTRPYSPDPSQYFQDVVVTFADLPEGDMDAIIAGVIALGGRYSGALSKSCTHLVTVDTDNKRCKAMIEKIPEGKIVLPHWFDDCFKLGRKINEEPYTFPNPEILLSNHKSKVRDIPTHNLDGAITVAPDGLPSSSPPSATEIRQNLNAFMGRKVMLSKDLQLGERLHKTLESLIKHGGGALTKTAQDADIYIGHYRDGDDYITASRAGKEVGNLSWLYHVINRNRYTSPLGKLLHYPIPREGIPGFQNMRISISNYSGDARVYLENLIKHSGAEFTRTMKQDNTHLITAHLQSEKVEAANEWNLHVVNHIWLEESYAKCAVQTLTNPRYQCFPARTNLGEVTGQTRFDMKRLENEYFPKSYISPMKTIDQPTSAATASLLNAHKTKDVGTPTPTLVGDAEEEAQSTKKPRGRPPKSAETPRLRKEEKENESPPVSGTGRASKAKALGMLHQQADDIALFNKEMKRKGGVTHGGRRSSQSEEMSPAVARKKRSSDEASYDVTAEGSELSDGETQPVQPTKKAKHTSELAQLPPVKFKMIVTGDERWLTSPKQESQDRVKLRQLGVQLTQDPGHVDILVAPKIMRTRKFISALASAPLVVDTKYLDVALQQNKLVEKPALLDDRAGEKRWGFRLRDTLDRAKTNKGKLFRGWSIFVTKDVFGTTDGFDTCKEIISLNGGAAFLYQGRSGTPLTRRRFSEETDASSESGDQGGDEESDCVYLVSGESGAEAKLWKAFRDLAAKQGLQARIAKKDWLLQAAMSQQIAWRKEWKLDDSEKS